MGFLDDLTNLSNSALEGKSPPTTRFVDWLHSRVSTNRDTDIHHPLGIVAGTASVGNHDHEGKNSVFLWALDEIPSDLPSSPTTAQIRDTVNAMLLSMRRKSG